MSPAKKAVESLGVESQGEGEASVLCGSDLPARRPQKRFEKVSVRSPPVDKPKSHDKNPGWLHLYEAPYSPAKLFDIYCIVKMESFHSHFLRI